MLVFAVFDTMVPLRLPNEYVNVCRKLVDALLIVITAELPTLASVQVTEDLRGIVSSDAVPLTVYPPFGKLLAAELLK